jgi:hypothetical protein
MNHKTMALALGLAALLPMSLSAQQRTGASFLKIGAGARALGMGSAFTAVSDDATGIFWNPAGLARLSRREAGAMHTEWSTGVRYDHLVYAHPSRWGTFAGGVAFLDQGDLERRGDGRENLGGFQAQDSSLNVSFSRPLSSMSAYGVGAKWIRQRIGEEEASGPALDAGFVRRIGSGFQAGLAVQNAGPGLKFINEKFALPLSISAGLQCHHGGGLTLAADVRRLVPERRTTVGVGTEYWLLDRVALRAGYLSSSSSTSLGTTADSSAAILGRGVGVNMGFGLRLGGAQMDYALIPSSAFGDTHHLSFSAKF